MLISNIKDTVLKCQCAQIISEIAIILNKYELSFVDFCDMEIEDKYKLLCKMHHDDYFQIEYLYQLLVDMHFIPKW